MHRSELLIEDEDVERIGIKDLHVGEHAHRGRIHTLIHANRQVLRDQRASSRPEQLEPGHCTGPLPVLENRPSIGLACLHRQPDRVHDDPEQAQVQLDYVEVERFKPSGGHGTRREEEHDETGEDDPNLVVREGGFLLIALFSFFGWLGQSHHDNAPEADKHGDHLEWSQ